MTAKEKWLNWGAERDWRPWAVAWWKRMPIIRHMRWLYGAIGVAVWYSSGPGSIVGAPTGSDDWHLFGIWKGWQ